MPTIIHTYVVLAYKESPYLENCIRSVLNQKYPSKVVIGTSTRCKYIDDIAKKYGLQIIENSIKGGGNAVDFDFAWNAGKTELVTIAHQDDLYDFDFSYEMVQAYRKYPDASIMFSDYYEVRDNKKVYKNRNLNIKRVLLSPLKLKGWSGTRFIKRRVLSLGNSICCPAVTFCKENIPYESVFVTPEVTGDSDWSAWLKLADTKGKFIYIDKPMMGHRVHDDSHTSRDINSHIRSPQDLVMFKKFWPTPIAKIINNQYSKSELSNNVKKTK